MLSTRRTINLSLCITLIVLCLLTLPVGGSEATLPGVQVELDGHEPLSLRVTVSSRAEARVSFPKYRLPWGNRNSMIFVPVDGDGRCVGDRAVPIDDSGYEKVSLGPSESITGNIDLRRVLPELEKELKKSDVHLFWAYAPPEELRIGRWSGGWLLIQQQK